VLSILLFADTKAATSATIALIYPASRRLWSWIRAGSCFHLSMVGSEDLFPVSSKTWLVDLRNT
jgi:hypothetical protein